MSDALHPFLARQLPAVRPPQPRRRGERLAGIVRRGERDYAAGVAAEANPFRQVGMIEAEAWWQGWYNASQARPWPDLQPGQQGVLF
jgi:hypothetical protein